MSPARLGSTPPRDVPGFSLIELIVVVAVFAVLLAIVSPSLSGGRHNARALVCSANTRSMAQGLAAYAEEHRDRLPPSYIAAEEGSRPEAPDWSVQASEGVDRPIIHWSSMVFGPGVADGEHARAFVCPEAPDGGAPPMRPRTGAGEMWQRSSPPPSDWQPPRLAYTVNGAVMPPGTALSGFRRHSRLVAMAEVASPELVILTTEFYHDSQVGWRAIAEANERSRSHRPIMPFIAGSMGAYDVFNEPNLGDQPRFFLPTDESIFTLGQFSRMLEWFGVVNVITSNAVSSLNAVGRSHPGPMKGAQADMGGAANFSYVDGHVDRRRALETLRDRLWGERFYGISGNNAVHPTERISP